MFLRLMLLFVFSTVVFAAPDVAVENDNVVNAHKNKKKMNEYFDALNDRIENTLINNEKIIEESNLLIEKLNRSVIEQNKNQENFISLLSDRQKIKEKTIGLKFEIATDWPYVIVVSISILASVAITWSLLGRDLKTNHNRLISEFRQKWVNDFRDTTSAYIDIASQIETFQQNNINFYFKRHALIELKTKFDLELVKVNINDINSTRLEAVKQNLKLQRDFEKDTDDEETEYYKLKHSEYLKLLSSAKVLESKLMLLLKPNFTNEDKLDKAVFNAVNELKIQIHSPQGRRGIINSGTLAHYSEELLKATQHLLKTEWDRIKKLDKKYL